MSTKLDPETLKRVEEASRRKSARLARMTEAEKQAEARRTAPRVNNRPFSIFAAD